VRPVVFLALAGCALVAAAIALAIYTPPIPDSEAPAWLDDTTIRFQSNFETKDSGLLPYVIAADGSAVRPATDAEAHQAPTNPPVGERLEFGSSGFFDAPLFLVDGQGHRGLIEALAYKPAGTALSPDGSTAVFAEWVGQHNAASVVLYAVATDGSSAPRRLTPTSCAEPLWRGAPIGGGTGRSLGGPLGGICFEGTDGPDKVVGSKRGDLVISGSGDDTIRAGDGQNVIQSQWGNDDIETGSGVDTVWAGDGNDLVRTGGGRDWILPGPGRDHVFAGAGPDIVIANDGEQDVIDCGPGDDRARVDRFDVTLNCEHVSVAPPAAGPQPDSAP
jgi:hypothetical protein